MIPLSGITRGGHWRSPLSSHFLLSCLLCCGVLHLTLWLFVLPSSQSSRAGLFLNGYNRGLLVGLTNGRQSRGGGRLDRGDTGSDNAREVRARADRAFALATLLHLLNWCLWLLVLHLLSVQEPDNLPACLSAVGRRRGRTI